MLWLAVFSVSVVLADSTLPEGVFQATDEPTVAELKAQSFVGLITAIDAEAGTVEIEALLESGESALYTIAMPEGFDFKTVAIGDVLEVTGSVDENGVVIADPLGDGENGGYYCSTPDATHPTAERIAETYGVDYHQVMDWFCKNTNSGESGNGETDGAQSNANTGFGEIALALQTAEIMGASADEILARRDDGLGWGQIWQELGYNGKPKTGETTAAEAGDAVVESANNAAAHANTNGNRPPEHANNDKDKGEKDKSNHGKGR